MNSVDWTASYRDFKLAIHILEEKFDEAIALMLSIGRSGEILKQSSYHTWPLFHKFRERPEFYSTYEKIYGEPYSTQVPTDGRSTSVSVSETGRQAKPAPSVKNSDAVSPAASTKAPPRKTNNAAASRKTRSKPPRGAA